MQKDSNRSLMPWQKAYLVVALITSISYFITYFQKPSSLPPGTRGLVPTLIGLIIVWSPLIFYWIGLRATSSISASIFGIAYFGAGILGMMTPEFPKSLALISLLMAIFYYFYSTKTWQTYEGSWLSEQKQKTEGRQDI
jgi:hypothetical protein